MNIYLSASFARRTELRRYMRQLESLGHVVTSRWLRVRHNGDNVSPALARKICREDLADLDNSELMILFLGGTNRGGKACELGYALALGIPIWVVGDPKDFTIFHLLAIRHYASWSAAKRALGGLVQLAQ